MNVLQGITTISFDADGTLWDFDKVMRHSLWHVLRELKHLDPMTAEQISIEKMIEIRNRVAVELKDRITNLEEVRLEAFKQTLIDIGRPNEDLARHLNQVYLKHRFEDIELFDDVLPALNVLREKYTLGILSNGNSFPERCGLDEMFKFVVFSQDYGVEKPDSRLFQAAIDQAGCSKEQIIHVGDSFENDVMGARNASIKCVWLNRKRVENVINVNADYEIEYLTELLELL